MTEIDFAGLSRIDVELNFFSAAKALWKSGGVESRFSSNSGRRCDLLYYMISGRRGYYIDDELLLTLEPGEAIFIPTGAVYYSEVCKNMSSEGIYVDFTMRNENGQILVTDPFYVMRDERLGRRFESIVENRADKLRVKAEIYRLLSEFSSNADTDGLTANERAVRSVMLEIERHPELPVDTAKYAHDCCLSATGFRNIFKNCSGGLSPLEYRNRVRMERADELMSSGGFTVAQISDILGFYDTAHFYRTYRAYREWKNSRPNRG